MNRDVSNIEAGLLVQYPQFDKYRLILLNPNLFKIELESYVNKELRFFKNRGVKSKGWIYDWLD